MPLVSELDSICSPALINILQGEPHTRSLTAISESLHKNFGYQNNRVNISTHHNLGLKRTEKYRTGVIANWLRRLITEQDLCSEYLENNTCWADNVIKNFYQTWDTTPESGPFIINSLNLIHGRINEFPNNKRPILTYKLHDLMARIMIKTGINPNFAIRKASQAITEIILEPDATTYTKVNQLINFFGLQEIHYSSQQKEMQRFTQQFYDHHWKFLTQAIQEHRYFFDLQRNALSLCGSLRNYGAPAEGIQQLAVRVFYHCVRIEPDIVIPNKKCRNYKYIFGDDLRDTECATMVDDIRYRQFKVEGNMAEDIKPVLQLIEKFSQKAEQ